jgi:PPK2 family polyphosphate:nucleotide phosphotransferase
VAKPGGKTESKRTAEPAADDKALKKSGKAKDAGKGGSKGVKATRKVARAKAKGAKAPKVGKSKQLRGAEQLVEKVAAQIVAAEFDRVQEENQQNVKNGVVATPADTAPADTAEKDKEKKDKGKKGSESAPGKPLAELLRVPVGPVDLADYDPSSTPGVASREDVEAALPALNARLDELQERLFAAARGGDSKRRVLLVLQGMDTSGKGGTVRHVIGQLDPNGVRLTAFKAPTEEELAHDFLWRIRAALPAPGQVGIFDRSHYEDVLAGKVRKLALPMVIGRRYILINKFEQGLADDGCVVVKCFLNIGSDEQRDRLLARLDNPDKHWKYNPGDVDDRLLWPQYQDAYRIALEKTSTEAAPWHVIPSNHKWYRNYAITRLLVETLEAIDPKYPVGEFDVAAERERVLAS